MCGCINAHRSASNLVLGRSPRAKADCSPSQYKDRLRSILRQDKMSDWRVKAGAQPNVDRAAALRDRAGAADLRGAKHGRGQRRPAERPRRPVMLRDVAADPPRRRGRLRRHARRHRRQRRARLWPGGGPRHARPATARGHAARARGATPALRGGPHAARDRRTHRRLADADLAPAPPIARPPAHSRAQVETERKTTSPEAGYPAGDTEPYEGLTGDEGRVNAEATPDIADDAEHGQTESPAE